MLAYISNITKKEYSNNYKFLIKSNERQTFLELNLKKNI